MQVQMDQGSSSCVVFSSCFTEQEDLGSIPGLAATISEIGSLLLPSRDMAEISL